jgi:hypothetical protein
MELLDQIEQMVNGDDKELQELGVLWFHQFIDSPWKGDTFNEASIWVPATVTAARIRVYKRRKQIQHEINPTLPQDHYE